MSDIRLSTHFARPSRAFDHAFSPHPATGGAYPEGNANRAHPQIQAQCPAAAAGGMADRARDIASGSRPLGELKARAQLDLESGSRPSERRARSAPRVKPRGLPAVIAGLKLIADQ